MNTKDSKKASQADWHPEKIKYELRLRGVTLSLLAAKHNLKDSSSLSACLIRPMKANEKRIADELGLHPKDIWPSRYDEDGSRRPQGIHAITKCTAAIRERNVNLQQAA